MKGDVPIPWVCLWRGSLHIILCLTLTLYYVVQELSQLQDKHATRPDVFDDVEEEQEIEILTQEITQVHNYDFCSFTPAIS